MFNDKLWVIVCVTVLCLATLGVAMHSTATIPDSVVALIEKAMYGLFGLAGGAGVGYAVGFTKGSKKEPTKTGAKK